MRRLLLALLVFGSFALGFRMWIDRPPVSRGSTPRAAEPVPAAPDIVEDEHAPRAPERLPEAEPEEPPTPAPQADDFPRALLAGHVRYRDGTAAAGVSLAVRAQGQRGQARPLASLRTAEDGSFEARVLGEGPFRVEASAESGGGVRVAATLEHVPADAHEVVLTLPYSGRVRGRVVDERGEPVRAFALEFERERDSEDEDSSRPVRADIESEDGTFESEPLASGPWQLVVTAAGYGPSSPRRCSVPDETPEAIRLTRACRLSGVVYGSDGRPRAGARVALSTAREPVFTDANGAFAISGGAGPLHLEATDPSTEAGAPLELTLEPGMERAGLVLRLGASGRVSGRVVTLGNRPAVARSVLFRPLPEGRHEESPPPCFTDELGRFLADLPPGQWEASVALDERELEALALAGPSEERPTEARSSEPVTVKTNETAELWIALAPAPVRVSGTLTKDGKPCQGGEVEAIDHQSRVTYRARVEGTSYALGLGRPGPHEFRVTFGMTTQSLWVDVPAKSAHELDLDVPVGWIEGFVRAWDGARLENVKVLASSPSGSQGYALTDADGSFVLELVPGTYEIGASAEPAGPAGRRPWERRPSVTVERDVRLTGLELVVARDPAPALEVVLRGPRGESVEGGRVSLTLLGWREPEVRSVEAPLGVATFPPLSAREVEVMAEAPGYFLAETQRVPVEWGKLRRVELALERAFEVVVRVRSGGATGPVHALDAVATSGLVFDSAPFTPDDGTDGPRFRWPLLPLGEYRVRVSAGGQVLERPLRVGAGGAEPAGLEISVP